MERRIDDVDMHINIYYEVLQRTLIKKFMNEKDERAPEIIADLHKNVIQDTKDTKVKEFIDNYHKYTNLNSKNDGNVCIFLS